MAVPRAGRAGLCLAGCRVCPGVEETWLAYVSYSVTAYVTVELAIRLPDMLRRLRTHPVLRRIAASAPVTRYRTDMTCRVLVSLYTGLGINLLYAVIRMASGLIYRSVWFGALAGYYLLLVLLRCMLLSCVSRARPRTSLPSGGAIGSAVWCCWS